MKANTMARKTRLAVLVIALNLLTIGANAQKSEKGVRIVKNEASRRVDVFIDGQPFTSYVWPEVSVAQCARHDRYARFSIRPSSG
jgi:hypothetical protein